MTLRVVVVGPADNMDATLTEVVDRALFDPLTTQVLYLAHDGAASRVLSQHPTALSEQAFLSQAVDVALAGSAEDIAALLAAEARGNRLSAVRCLPAAPARAVEMLERWMLLSVYDKAVLEEDDIANAQVILYGKSERPALTRFGPRCFFSPGPLSAGCIGVLELQNNGDLVLQIVQLDGQVREHEHLPALPPKLVVTA